MANDFGLTKGALKAMLDGAKVKRPVVQFLGLDAAENQPPSVQLSDGVYTVTAQTSCFFSMEHKKQKIPRFAIVVVSEFVLDTQVINGIERKVLVVIRLDSDKSGSIPDNAVNGASLLDLGRAKLSLTLHIPQYLVQLIGSVQHNQNVNTARKMPGISSITDVKLTPCRGVMCHELRIEGVTNQVIQQAAVAFNLHFQVADVPVKLWGNFTKNGNKLLKSLVAISGATIDPAPVTGKIKPLRVVGLGPNIRQAVEAISTEIARLRSTPQVEPDYPTPNNPNNKSRQQTAEKIILVPVELVHAFTANREELLNQIRTAYQVKINPEANEDNWKPFRVTGTPEKVEGTVERIKSEVARLRRKSPSRTPEKASVAPNGGFSVEKLLLMLRLVISGVFGSLEGIWLSWAGPTVENSEISHPSSELPLVTEIQSIPPATETLSIFPDFYPHSWPWMTIFLSIFFLLVQKLRKMSLAAVERLKSLEPYMDNRLDAVQSPSLGSILAQQFCGFFGDEERFLNAIRVAAGATGISQAAMTGTCVRILGSSDTIQTVVDRITAEVRRLYEPDLLTTVMTKIQQAVPSLTIAIPADCPDAVSAFPEDSVSADSYQALESCPDREILPSCSSGLPDSGPFSYAGLIALEVRSSLLVQTLWLIPLLYRVEDQVSSRKMPSS